MFVNYRKIALPFLILIYQANVFAESPIGCIIEPDRVAELGSQVIGVVESISVERGDKIRKGQILATLRSDVERASVGVAETRSKLIADVEAAKANLALAKSNERRGHSLVISKFISEQALEKSHAETEVAKERLALAHEQLKVAGSELTLARAQLGQRVIRAPFDGIVADRYVWPGERVEEKPLFKVVKIDLLRVELVAPVTLFGTIDKNSYVTITPLMPNSSPIEAKVTLVDKIIDGASNTFRVRAEIPNHALEIPSGLRCKVSLSANDASLSANAPVEAIPTEAKPAKPVDTSKSGETPKSILSNKSKAIRASRPVEVSKNNE